MVNIFLEGKLGKMFGRVWQLEISSPAEALRAININLKGKLFDYLANEGAKKYYKIAIDKKKFLLEPDEVRHKTGHNDIYIMPTIKGSNSGVGKIIAGIVLVVLAVYSGGAALSAGGVLGGFAAPVAAMGASLILGGATQLLTPKPKFSGQEDTARKSSNVFQGNATTISQGGSVPLVYGRMLVIPMPISIAMTNEDSATTAASIGSVEVTELPGGGYEYTPVAAE